MAGNRAKLRELDNDLRNDEYWGGLLNKHLPPTVDYRLWECYGIVKNDKPIVAWCYHSYQNIGSNRHQNYEAEISICSFDRSWAKKSNISVMLALFFYRDVYNRLTALIRIDNRQAVKLVKLAGFTLEGVIRRPRNELDILQFSILKEDWEVGRFYELNR